MKECVNEEFVVLYMFGSALSESSHLLNFIIVQYLYRTQNPEQEIVSSAAHGDSGTNSGSSGRVFAFVQSACLLLRDKVATSTRHEN